MSYIELLVCLIISTIIFISALDGYSHVLQHMAYILNTNIRTLRVFHVINYIRFDYHRHATKQPNSKYSKTLSTSSFAFDEKVENLKRVLYKCVGPLEGKTTIYRDTYDIYTKRLLNRRVYTLYGEFSLELSADKRYLLINNPYYGVAKIPISLPDVQIVSIIVTKVRENNETK
ncbi:MAG: hypothetical protein WHS64_05795 [Fervidobacterium sp.]|uniref:Uncharacterized protein n=2 Tax=Fervidobacterium gondwanense TaxID=44754 RepID=A0A1M7SEK4_FERGO|nr:hypothetical protein [Fervidobacterium gondwanense]UXF01185.1 hypothetical protein IB67_06430 [Fervidobacterium riparium]SHN56712.1 hypothetical protein SAMN02745226_00807 [Fervidobacterium gondwanense DSM 13020]